MTESLYVPRTRDSEDDFTHIPYSLLRRIRVENVEAGEWPLWDGSQEAMEEGRLCPQSGGLWHVEVCGCENSGEPRAVCVLCEPRAQAQLHLKSQPTLPVAFQTSVSPIIEWVRLLVSLWYL